MTKEFITGTKVYPAGKARNTGVEKATGEFLLFLDDDAFLGTDKVIEELVKAIEFQPEVGISGAATLKPKNLNWFEKRYYKEFPRGQFVPKDEVEENDMATTLCCLVRRELFLKTGGFNEKLVASEDPEFRDRIRHLGYTTLVVRDAPVIHPPPSNLDELWKRSLWYGKGEAQAYRLFKGQSWRDTHYMRSWLWGLFRLMFWWIGFLINIDKLTQGRWPFSLQLLRPIATLGHGIGYIKGLSKIKSIN